MDKRNTGPTTIRAGKNGITEALIKEIRTILDKRKEVRVKLLKTSLAEKDKKAIQDELKAKSKARNAKMIGHTITLTK
jgi:RNA-binding protein YhbY